MSKPRFIKPKEELKPGSVPQGGPNSQRFLKEKIDTLQKTIIDAAQAVFAVDTRTKLLSRAVGNNVIEVQMRVRPKKGQQSEVAS